MKRERLGRGPLMPFSGAMDAAPNDDPALRLLAQAKSRPLADDECAVLQRRLSGTAQDDPPPGTTPPPKRLDPAQTIVKPGPGARQQATSGDDGDDPGWIGELLGTIRPHVPGELHDQVRGKLLKLHAAGWGQGEPAEHGQLLEETADGLSRPAMDRMLAHLPPHLVSFRTATFSEPVKGH